MSKIVNRTLDFFELFGDRKQPLTLSEIAKALEIPVSSAHDALQTLSERGYVYELGPRGGFYPTLKLQQLAVRIAENDPVLMRAELQLRALLDEFDESISLARVADRQAIYLLVLEPSHPLRFMVRVGDRARRLHATSAGKAVLGSLTASELAEVLDGLELDALTPATLTDRAALEADIAASRTRGWYLNRGESVPGALTVSATFRWNRSVFIVTVAGPDYRVEPKLDHLIARLHEVCRQIEAPGQPGQPGTVAAHG